MKNAYVERIFSMVNPQKSDSRSLLNITTVNSIIQVKAYYDLYPKFESTKEDYFSIAKISNVNYCYLF